MLIRIKIKTCDIIYENTLLWCYILLSHKPYYRNKYFLKNFPVIVYSIFMMIWKKKKKRCLFKIGMNSNDVRCMLLFNSHRPLTGDAMTKPPSNAQNWRRRKHASTERQKKGWRLNPTALIEFQWIGIGRQKRVPISVNSPKMGTRNEEDGRKRFRLYWHQCLKIKRFKFFTTFNNCFCF